MGRLTHERVNGIKTGYWSSAKKEELVNRLAEYENTGLDPDTCSDYKRFEDEVIASGLTFNDVVAIVRKTVWMNAPKPYREVGQ